MFNIKCVISGLAGVNNHFKNTFEAEREAFRPSGSRNNL
jgi:hypothetical protein